MAHPSLCVQSTLFAPFAQLAAQCAAFRSCPSLPDEDWLLLGTIRALHDEVSGRAFLQRIGVQLPHCPAGGHFFETLKSARRLALCQQASERVARKLTDDPFAHLAGLHDFDVYAADGHWHGAAVHDAPIDGSKRATGHFFALDLRTQALRPLALGQGKKEHDMHVLKRLTLDHLRHHAPAGRKVLYAYDCASIDYAQWQKWKQTGGLYFVSLTKEKMVLTVTRPRPIDRQDPNHVGITADDNVVTSEGIPLRRIRYTHPATGEIYEFLTSECTLPPGVIAFVYLRRWDIEKVFDELKNKFSEQRAWASTPVAKQMQACFLCLAHNLIQLFERHLAHEHAVRNQAEEKRRARRLAEQVALAKKRGTTLPELVRTHQRLTQTSVKLYRWLRAHFFSPLPLIDLLPSLTHSYATL
jgi:hypothetical protein